MNNDNFIDFEGGGQKTQHEIFVLGQDQAPPKDSGAAGLVRHLSTIQIPSFDGKKNHLSLDAFFEEIEKHQLTHPEISEEDVVRIAIGKCTGHAFNVIKEAIPNIKELKDLKERLRSGCCLYTNPDIYEQQLNNCKQERREPVSDYYQRVCSIQQQLERCRKQREETSAQKKIRLEEERAKILQRGLRPSIRSYIRRLGITDLEKILHYAAQEEAYEDDPADMDEHMVAFLEDKFKNLEVKMERQAAPSQQYEVAALAQQPQLARQQPFFPQSPPQAAPGAPVQQQHYFPQVPPQNALPHQVQQQQYAAPPVPFQQQQYAAPQAPFQQQLYAAPQVPFQHQQGFAPTGQQGGRKRRPGVVCYNCQKPGHYKNECRSQFPCSYCGIRGHGVSTCPEVPCTTCNTKGHTPRNCPSNALNQQPLINQKNGQ